MEYFILAPFVARDLEPFALVGISAVTHAAQLPIFVSVGFHPDAHLLSGVHDLGGRQ